MIIHIYIQLIYTSSRSFCVIRFPFTQRALAKKTGHSVVEHALGLLGGIIHGESLSGKGIPRKPTEMDR
jgi:hypothetical protein